jgi:hypothetical protein
MDVPETQEKNQDLVIKPSGQLGNVPFADDSTIPVLPEQPKSHKVVFWILGIIAAVAVIFIVYFIATGSSIFKYGLKRSATQNQKQVSPAQAMVDAQKQLQQILAGGKIKILPPTFGSETALPADLKFLVPSQATQVKIRTAKFGSSLSGYNINYILGGDLQFNFTEFSVPPKSWQLLTRRNTNNTGFTELQQSLYDVSIQMTDTVPGTTNVVIEIIKK